MTGRKSHSTRVRRYGFVAAALLIVTAGCGSDDDEASDTTEAVAVTTTAASTETTEAPEATTATTEAESDETTASTAATATTATTATTAAEVMEDCPADQNIPQVRMGNSVPPASLSPLFGQGSGSGYNALIAVYDELMHFDPATGEFVPGLAESLVPNDDLTEWTMTLKEGVTFGSGNPFTTEAVQWNIEHVAAEGSTAATAALARRITAMEIVSPLEMTFTLAAPYADFPVMLGAPLGSIVDPAVYEAFGDPAAADEAFNAGAAPGAGAGPYEVESWDRTVSVVMKRKDTYWGPMPCVEVFEEVFFSDNQTRNDAFVNGELEAVYLRGPNPNRLMRESEPDGVGSFSQVVNGGSVLVINQGVGDVVQAAADVRVRQAIGYAIDPSVINDRVYAGSGRASKAFLDEDSAFFTPAIEELAYDPDEATRLLDEAKAEGYDGKLIFRTSNTPDAVDTGLIIEAQLEAVGFEIEFDATLDGAGVSNMLLTTHDFDLTTSAISAFDSDILSELARRVAPWTGYESEAWTAALAGLGTANGVDEKQDALAEVARVWNEEVPMVTLDHHEVRVVWNGDFEGFTFSKAGFVMIDEVRPAG